MNRLNVKTFFLCLIFSFFISSCSSSNHSKKLLNEVNLELKKKYNISYGYIAATYDLPRFNKDNKLFAKDYVRIINEPEFNKHYLKHYKNKDISFKTLENEAHKKNNKIKLFLLRLDKKYKILSSAEINFIKNKKNYLGFISHLNESKNKNLEELLKLDKIAENIPLLMPMSQAKISSFYGIRKHPIKRSKKFHLGIDLIGKTSAPIYSAGSGKVIKVARIKGYGNIVEIAHQRGYRTKYAHLKKIIVKEGQTVIRGQKIGLQGKTGNATGQHLHYEIWLHDHHINPYDFLSHGL